MRNCFDGPQRRTGTRVRAQIPLRITSLDPATKCSETCHTVIVNPSGCGIRFRYALEPGTQVRVDDLPGGISATARVASKAPFQSSDKYFLIGIKLDQPANWWCMAPSPQDWEQYSSAPQFAAAR